MSPTPGTLLERCHKVFLHRPTGTILRFYPQSAQSLEDIAFERAANDVAELIDAQQRSRKQITLQRPAAQKYERCRPASARQPSEFQRPRPRMPI